jgi:ATP-dependent Lhr-like helicase
VPWLEDQGLDSWAAENLVAYVAEQADEAGHVPTDRTIVVERTRDELGDWRLTVLSPYGAQVHAPWALLVRERLTERFGVDAAVLHGDDGIVARLPDLPGEDWIGEAVACLFPEPEDVEPSVTRLIGASALFAARFREAASRALLLPRLRPGRRAPLWQQRQRSAQLLQIAAEHPTFPIVLEAVRECLQDVYDLPSLVELMTAVAERRVQVVEVSPHAPSPFARSLLFGYVAEFLYEGDSPLAERRAAALTLDPTLLGELLGQTDLRELLDPTAIEEVVARLQHLTEDRAARHGEDAADMLRQLGPLSTEQAAQRGVSAEWLSDLEGQRRVFRTRLAGTEVWAVVEDAPRLRDGLGSPVPPGIAEAHLRPVDDAVGDLISRYTRTHGPFTTQELAESLGLPPAVVLDRLTEQRAAGRILEGRFLAEASGTQWCHPDVLRLVKRRSVALLRHQIEPVSQPALAAFLPAWQHVAGAGAQTLRGVEGVYEAVRALAGVPVPASALESAILPIRVPGYTPAMLDELTSSGDVVWTGTAALPGGDGWIALAPADDSVLLPRAAEPPSATAAAIQEVLGSGGGWFLSDLVARLGGAELDASAIAEALRELLWAGLVSNDTIEPVRADRDRVRARRRRSDPRRGRPVRPPRGRYADLWRSGSRAGSDASEPGAGISDTAHTTRPARGPLASAADLPGRWFALPEPDADAAARAVASAQAHLDRCGLVTRGAVTASGDPGGFAAAYRTLSAMEDRGRVHRIYAVEGLGASQFALPGVVDQLRAVERELAEAPPRTLVLPAADPANAYGAALEWPASQWAGSTGTPHRPARAAGSHVVLRAGRPVLYLERGGRSILTFEPGTVPGGAPDATEPGDPLGPAFAALVSAVRAGHVPDLLVTRINGVGAMEPSDTLEPVVAAMTEAGFTLTPKGYRLRR